MTTHITVEGKNSTRVAVVPDTYHDDIAAMLATLELANDHARRHEFEEMAGALASAHRYASQLQHQMLFEATWPYTSPSIEAEQQRRSREARTR